MVDISGNPLSQGFGYVMQRLSTSKAARIALLGLAGAGMLLGLSGCQADTPTPDSSSPIPTDTAPSPTPEEQQIRDCRPSDFNQGYLGIECPSPVIVDDSLLNRSALDQCLVHNDLELLYPDSPLRVQEDVPLERIVDPELPAEIVCEYDSVRDGGYDMPVIEGNRLYLGNAGMGTFWRAIPPSPTATEVPPTATPEPSPTATDVPASPTPAYTPTPGPNSDIDGDGIPLWEEQLYGTNPEVAENWGDYGFVWPLLDTPEKSAGFANRHLRFMSDAPATFITPQETLTRGGGNCTMNATFTCDPLLRNGYNFMGTTNQAPAAAPFNVQWVASDPRGGHATCVYTLNGSNLYYIDNTKREFGVIRGPFNTIEQIKDDMARRSNAEWRWYEFFTTSYQFGYGRVDKP
jgi:hypothetical protein